MSPLLTGSCLVVMAFTWSAAPPAPAGPRAFTVAQEHQAAAQPPKASPEKPAATRPAAPKAEKPADAPAAAGAEDKPAKAEKGAGTAEQPPAKGKPDRPRQPEPPLREVLSRIGQIITEQNAAGAQQASGPKRPAKAAARTASAKPPAGPRLKWAGSKPEPGGVSLQWDSDLAPEDAAKRARLGVRLVWERF